MVGGLANLLQTLSHGLVLMSDVSRFTLNFCYNVSVIIRKNTNICVGSIIAVI